MNPILPSPERTMLFKCQRCGAEVKVYDDTRQVNCADCASEMIVERKHGTIGLVLAEAPPTFHEEEMRGPLSFGQLNNELTGLKDESSRIRRRKMLVLLVGGACGLIFAGFGIAGVIANDLGLGMSMLLCAGGAAWFVLFVLRDSTAAAARINGEMQQLEHQADELRRGETQRISASNLGIDHIAVDLYLREVRYYPSWIRHSRSRVPERVSDARKDGIDMVKLTMRGVEYLFDWKQKRLDSGQEQGVLTLAVDDTVVLMISALLAEDHWMISASAHSVLRFVEGPWVEEFVALWAESKECMSQERKP